MKLVLLDSHALIHRAYHAIPRLTSPTGEPTNATFGFTNTLLKVLNDEQPDFIAAAFDVGKSFRDDLFAEYKAQRPELADDLHIQLERSRQIIEAMGIPAFGLEGYEADDLLGTLARQATERGIETIIVTGDTDTLQLVNPHVRVLMFTPQAKSGMTLYDERAVQERYQLKPHQLIDFKALKGDPSDNVPGVPGIGEKTAAKLIQTFGSLEAVYQHLDEIEKRWQDKLRAGQSLAEQSKKLVTIVTDAPIRFDPEACRVSQLDLAKATPLLRELGFRSLIERLPGAVPTEVTPPSGEQYHTVDTKAALEQLVARLRQVPAFVIDVETTDTDPMRAELVGIAIGMGGGEAYYIPLKTDERPKTNDKGQLAFDTMEHATRNTQHALLDASYVLEKLKPIFADASIPKYAHNAKYDLTVLAEAGIEVRGLAFDSMIAAHLIEPGAPSLSLKNLVLAKFGVQMTEIETLIGKGKRQISMAQVEIDQVARYACADADYTYRLVEHYQPQLAERGVAELFYQVEMPLIRC
jgi:DNA polymerase-1